jgi:hypothetical protein
MATPAAPPVNNLTEQQILEALLKDPKSRRVLQLETKKKFPDYPIPEIDAASEIEERFASQLNPLKEEVERLRGQLASKQSTDSWEGAKEELRRKYGWSDKTIESFKADLEKEFANGEKPLGYTDLAEYWMMKRNALQPTGVTTISGRQMQAEEQDMRKMLDDPTSDIFNPTKAKKLMQNGWEAAKQELAMRP